MGKIITQYTNNLSTTKVVSFEIILHLQKEYSAQQKSIIEEAAKNCPVGKSLDATIERKFFFQYNLSS